MEKDKLETKEQVRPLYGQLQGLLKGLPNRDGYFRGEESWLLYHQVIEELNNITGKDYNLFKVKTDGVGQGASVDLEAYRTQVSSLISRLQGEFFHEEPADGSTPSTIINQNQTSTQNQSTNIQIALDIQGRVSEKIEDHKEGSQERSFLEKLKGKLNGVNGFFGALKVILDTAKDYGLTLGGALELLL